jgi:hypothetical protein
LSPLDPLYLLIIVTGLLVTTGAALSIVWLIAVAIAWPAFHRAARRAGKN